MAKLKQMSPDEREWQAESDANLMARYEELMSDAPRLKRAVKKAKEMADDLEKSANRMKKVADKK